MNELRVSRFRAPELGRMQPEELESQRREIEAQKVVIDKLVCAAEKAKEEGRMREIRQVVADHKSAGVRRGIEHGMKAMNMLEDVDELWVGLAETAEAGGLMVATPHNLVEVNAAIDKQAEIFVKLKNHVQHEVAMQVVASKSPLAWKTVKKMEGSGEFNKEQLGIGEKDVRTAEKELMQYERDIAAAVGGGGTRRSGPRAAGRSGFYGGDGGNKDYQLDAPGDKSGPPYAAAGRGVGSDGGIKCYGCGELGHIAYFCRSRSKRGLPAVGGQKRGRT